MIDKRRAEVVLKKLQSASCFTHANIDQYRDDTDEVVFEVGLSPALAPEFVRRMRVLFLAKRRAAVADDEIEAELTAMLLPQLSLRLPFGMEFHAYDGIDPDDPVLPDGAALVVQFPAAKAAKKTKPKSTKRSGTAAPDFSSVTDAERKAAVRRGEERLRSRRRRAQAKAARQDAGEVVRVGKRGYVVRVYDPRSEREVWKPTAEGRKVMREIDKVWETTISTGAALARHLNAKGLHSLGGKPFTRNMMTALVRYVELLRRDGTL